MSEPGSPTRALRHRGDRNRASGAEACATCAIDLDVRKLDRHAGFCHECLDRSRISDDDDLGGEC